MLLQRHWCKKVLRLPGLCGSSRLGANLSISSSSANKIEDAQRRLQALCTGSQKVLAFVCDVRREDDVEKMVTAASAALGVPDMVIPCAGLALPGYFLSVPTATFRDQMDLNYFGSLYLVKACVKLMAPKKRGHVVFISSAAALGAFVGYSMYCPTKYAVRGLAEALRNELLLHNISVSIFYPSSMKTPGYEEEEKRKPAECKEIEGSASVFTAAASAQHLLAGLRAGQYQITQEVGTWLLRVAGNGVAPRNFLLLEALLVIPVAAFGAGFSFYMDWVVRRSPNAKRP